MPHTYHFDFGNICEMGINNLEEIIKSLEQKDIKSAKRKSEIGLRGFKMFLELYESKNESDCKDS